MTKLCEVVAVVKDRKAKGERVLTDANKIAQKPGSFEGRSRVYSPSIDGGMELPPENDAVQNTVSALVESIRGGIVALLDVTRTQDQGNRHASADIKIEAVGDRPGFELLDVPATHLLYLERFFGDMLTFVGNLPVLDPSVDWAPGHGTGIVRSVSPVVKTKTAKTPEVIVKYEATEEHPAQTELIYLDKIVGSWSESRFSGAISASDKKKMIDRVTALRDAVRQGRERANAQEVESMKQGEAIFGFIFGE